MSSATDAYTKNYSAELKKEFEDRVRQMEDGVTPISALASEVARQMREGKKFGGRMGYGAGGIISGWVAKQLVKKTAKPVTQKSIDFSSDAIVKRLDNYNIKPNDIVSEDQLLKVLDSVKQAETNVFNNKFGNIMEQGMEGITKLKKADGGRIGYYGGGMTNMVEPDLSDIGHGTDSLNARTRVMSPGSQATTSTGLNYLLGEDNDNTRVPFAGGGKGMNKRGFLKLLGGVGAGIAGLKSGILGFGGKKAAVKEVAKQAATSGGVPPYFFKLVEKIKFLGDDVTSNYATKDREIVKKYKDFELTEDVSTGRIEIQRYKQSDEATYYGQPLTEETYMSYTPGETLPGKGKIKPLKTADEYEEGTALLRSDRGNAGDIVDESATISDDVIKEGTVFEDTLSEFGKADGGRIGYSKGKLVKEGIPALIKKIQDKFGKNSIKVLENEPDYGLSVLNDYTIPRPESAVLRDKMKNFGKPGKFNDDGSIDYDYYAEILNDSENTFVYGDEPIEELLSMEKETLDNYNEMKAMYDRGELDKYAPSKFDNVNDDQIAAAVDDIFPSGDYKYDAEMAAEALVENNPQIFKDMLYEDLDDITRSKIYSSVLEVLSGKNAKMLQMKRRLSKPEKTLEGIKNTGTIDISNPDVAEEFTKFMKESDPKGFKDIEQKIQLESFDPKKTKGNAKGGRITYSSGGLAAMLGE